MAELQGDPNAAIKELRKQVSIIHSIILVKNVLISGPKRLDLWSTISKLIIIQDIFFFK